MKSVDVTEFATRFDEFLDRANQGEQITVTRVGLPYAMLGPKPDREAALAAADRIARTAEEIRRRSKITPEEIKSWINEGRP